MTMNMVILWNISRVKNMVILFQGTMNGTTINTQALNITDTVTIV